jgi:hypothetical protein
MMSGIGGDAVPLFPSDECEALDLEATIGVLDRDTNTIPSSRNGNACLGRGATDRPKMNTTPQNPPRDLSAQ